MARARWRLWDGSPLRHRGFRFPRDAQSIRECALHGLVGIPPCALQRRLAASCASRRRIRSGHVVSAAPSRPRYSQDVGASVAACTSPSAPRQRFAPSWRACACLARSEAWRRRHEAEQAQTAGRARRRDCACAARREVFRPSASLRRRGWIARLTADARAVAGGAPPQRLPKLSADRMCWAGNAAAVSRARCARSAGLRRTRIPKAIFRLSSGARTQQDGTCRMAGEVAAAFSAYGLANTHKQTHTNKPTRLPFFRPLFHLCCFSSLHYSKHTSSHALPPSSPLSTPS